MKDLISALDRGLHYGDGLFETVAWFAGEMPLWPWHYRRLVEGARRLGMPVPDEAACRADVEEAMSDQERGVAKLIVTRGPGGRGYAPPPAATCTRLCLRYPYPMDSVPAEGITLGVCRTRLALQPALAGIKHLNRLEQVLAALELNEGSVADGLMLDTEGGVVEATASNLFFFDGDDGWVTPRVDRCGVAGTLRAWLLEQGCVRESRVALDDLADFSACAVGNAVRGITPVNEITGVARYEPDESLALRRRAPIPPR